MVFAAQRQGFDGSAPLETEKIPPSKHGVIVRFFIAEVDALRPNGKAPIYLDYNGWSSQPGFLGESELMGPNRYPLILQISL